MNRATLNADDMHLPTSRALLGVMALLLVGVAGCGGSSRNAHEASPAGDIPDNQAYVGYAPPHAGFSIKVPEGWSRTTSGGAVTFSDKLNAIRVQSAAAHTRPTVRQATRADVPRLAATVSGFQRGTVTAVARKAGGVVRITYIADAERNPVTGRTGRNAVERYLFFHRGRVVTLTLSGPKGADNVDPWRTVTDSLAWSR